MPGDVAQLGRRRAHLPLPRLRWARKFRQHDLLRSSMWILPTCYVVGALLVGLLVPHLDRRLAIDTTLPAPDDTRAILAAIATGMMTLTGFVFSFLLLLVQFGSTAFTPRLNRLLRRDWVVKHALGVFTSTFVLSLCGLAAVDRVGPGILPLVTLLTVSALLLGSIGLFFAMVSRVVDELRVSRVIRLLAAHGRRVLDEVYPEPFHDDEIPSVPDIRRDTPVQEVRHDGPSAVLVAIDRAGLATVAHRVEATIEHVPAVGDDIASGAVLFRVYGPRPVPENVLRAALVLGDERTLDDDPAFALRLLVDIAIRALSPAVNDPTTAVQALDGIADILTHAASKHLEVTTLGANGTTWVIGPMATWVDLLRLGVTEIRMYGQDSVQVLRRLRALLDGVLASAPAARHAAVHDEIELLDATLERQLPRPAEQLLARQPDPQGLGPTRLSPPAER